MNNSQIFSAYCGKKIGVFGLGKSGLSALKALTSAGAEIYVWDDSVVDVPEKKAHFEPWENWPWETLDALVLSPGVPLTYPQPHDIVTKAKAHHCPIICDIELLYHSHPDATYVAVTGTNGKSTTTALIAHICKELGIQHAMGGNIGIAVGDLPVLDKGGVYVLELSSYQLDLLDQTKFDVAVLLNITADHIDRHGDMVGYVAAKKRIFKHQSLQDTAIICVENSYCADIYEDMKNRAHVVPVSVGSDNVSIGNFPRLAGRHNQQNIACAMAAIKILGNYSDEEIIKAIASFEGLAHRLQLINKINGVTYVNDSKATNDVATWQALNAYENIYWIVGGVAKEGGITSLEPLFKNIKHAFLLGQAEDEFAASLDGKVPYTKCGNLDNAFKQASQSAQKDKIKSPIVLLSPACASFDQFKNFEQRGQAFIDMVSKLHGN